MEAPILAPPSAEPAPQPDAEHAYRASLLDEERRFVLRGDTLSVLTEKGGERRIPLAAVRRVHLGYNRSKVRSYFTCKVTLSDGSSLKIGNTHFAGLANFQDRAATYTPFVLALHAALAPYRDRVDFRAGSWANFIAAGLAIPLFLAIGAVTIIFQRWLLTLGVLLTMTWVVPNLLRSRPQRYTPETVPRRLLP